MYYCRLTNNEIQSFTRFLEEGNSIFLVIAHVLYHEVREIQEELACKFLCRTSLILTQKNLYPKCSFRIHQLNPHSDTSTHYSL